MSDASPHQDIFDVRKIRRLVELMKEHDLSGDRPARGGDADPDPPRDGAGD